MIANYLIKPTFYSLRYSYGLPTTPTCQRKAVKLADSIKEIRPAVYKVGNCIIDLWLKACSCKHARAHGQNEDCPHYIALFVAGIWSPVYSPVTYYKSIGVEHAEIIGIYARVNEWQGRQLAKAITARIEKTGTPGVVLAILPDGYKSYISIKSVRRVTPFYA